MDYVSVIVYGLASLVVGGAFTLGVCYVGFHFGYRHGHRLYQESSIEPTGWVDNHDMRKTYKAYVPGQKESKLPELR